MCSKFNITAFIRNIIIYHTSSTAPAGGKYFGRVTFQNEKHQSKQAQTTQEIPLALPMWLSAINPPLKSDV